MLLLLLGETKKATGKRELTLEEGFGPGPENVVSCPISHPHWKRGIPRAVGEASVIKIGSWR